MLIIVIMIVTIANIAVDAKSAAGVVGFRWKVVIPVTPPWHVSTSKPFVSIRRRKTGESHLHGPRHKYCTVSHLKVHLPVTRWDPSSRWLDCAVYGNEWEQGSIVACHWGRGVWGRWQYKLRLVQGENCRGRCWSCRGRCWGRCRCRCRSCRGRCWGRCRSCRGRAWGRCRSRGGYGRRGGSRPRLLRSFRWCWRRLLGRESSRLLLGGWLCCSKLFGRTLHTFARLLGPLCPWGRNCG